MNILVKIHVYGFCQTLTVIFRANKFNINENVQHSYFIDVALFFNLPKKGKGFMMNDAMGVYRLHSGGVWSCVSINNQVKTEFNARIGIYNVEQSYEAAFFLRNQFTKLIRRKWMLSEWRLMLKTYKILSKHFGCISMLKLYGLKLLFNKMLEY